MKIVHRAPWVLAAVCLGISSSALAANFDVSNETQLQTALLTARANGQDDVVNVHAGLYKISNNGGNPFRYIASNTEDQKLTLIGDGAATTILDGELTKQAMVLDTTAVVGDADASISIAGMTFSHGSIAGTGGALEVQTTDADLAITNCAFKNSVVTQAGSGTLDGSGGGAIYFAGGSGNVTVTGSVFSGNDAESAGGGLAAASFNGNVVIDSTLFHGNHASGSTGAGGGFLIYALGGRGTLTNSIVSENTSPGGGLGGGGSIILSSLGANVVNNDFYNNFTAGGGGGLILLSNASNLSNNIFLDNASLGGDGNDVFVDDTSTTSLVVFNNIFSELCLQSGSCDVTTLGDNQGGNLIGVDPLFADANAGDFGLLLGSPAINAGLEAVEAFPDFDFNGHVRVEGPAPDMGAIEADACGDGAVESGEECDDGASNSDTAADACRTTCLNPSCGDGAVDTGEDCDDGNTADGDGCSAACQEESPAGGTTGAGTGGGTSGTTGGTGGSSGGCSLVR